jgi:hypothetical protein
VQDDRQPGAGDSVAIASRQIMTKNPMLDQAAL